MTEGQRLLDIGCGPGEWALEMASNQDDCQVVGIDTNELMIEYARSCAYIQGLSNVQFERGNAREPLSYPDVDFNLIHVRFAISFLLAREWPAFFAECFRLLRPGGVLYNTELEDMGRTNSSALARFCDLFVQFMRLEQRCFTEAGSQSGIRAVQVPFLEHAGFHAVRQKQDTIDYSAGMPAHALMVENYLALMQVTRPALVGAKVATPEELSLLSEQALGEMQREDFYGLAFYQTVWGRKSASSL